MESRKKEEERGKKRIISSGIKMLLMLLPGFSVDILYYLRDYCPVVKRAVHRLYCIFQPWGITYNSAMDIIGGIVGIIVTMVGLFISTNINLFQRSEKNSFGITYKEMQEIVGGKWQKVAKWTKRVSCIAPLMLIPVLNFRLCVTGYLLYVYCCVSVVLQYFLYSSSFSRGEIPQKVVAVLLNEVPRDMDWKADGIQRFDMRLMAVAESLKTERNWLEVEILFDVLLRKLENYDLRNQQIAINHFYRIVCCRQTESMFMVHQLWEMYLEKANCCVLRTAGQEEKKEEDAINTACFWGMAQAAVYELSEQELEVFIDHFLQFREQGINAYSRCVSDGCFEEQDAIPEDKTDRDLNRKILNRRSCIFLVLLEYRFRKKYLLSEQLARTVVQLKKFGDCGLDEIEKDEMIGDINKYIERDSEMFTDIFSQLLTDRANGESRCCVNNLAGMFTL